MLDGLTALKLFAVFLFPESAGVLYCVMVQSIQKIPIQLEAGMVVAVADQWA